MAAIKASERLGGAVSDPTRPSDWLPMPTVVDGDQVVHLLVSVWNDDANYLAIEFEGNYTVDWGEGTVVNYAGGVTAERRFVFTDYSVSSETANGYRQAMVTITPQSGANLTRANITKLHSSLSGFTQSNTVLEVVSAGSFLEFVKLKEGVRSRLLRNFTHVGACNFNTMQEMFNDASSLKIVKGLSLSQSLSLFRAFSFTAIECIDSGSVDLQNNTDMTQAFRDCSCLRHITADMSAATTLNSTFLNCNSLSSVDITGIKVSVSFANCSLAAAELNKIFTDLVDLNANALPAATITITGNHGAAGCDPTIATAKGWTVTQ